MTENNNLREGLIQVSDSETSQIVKSLPESQIEAENNPRKIYQFDSLSKIQIFGYGVGHFYNDLCAACWFNYLLYFLKSVLQLDFAPYCMLAGQIADAISTPIIGYYSDKTETKIGKRTPWYIFGLIMVLLTFLPVFHDIGNQPQYAKIIWYISFPSLFNVGWAAVQISHMSLVPSLSCSRKRRDNLNSLRNTFTFMANLVVLICALILFDTESNAVDEFEQISYIVTGLGFLTSIFFLFQIREVNLTKACSEITNSLISEITKRREAKKKLLHEEQKQLLLKDEVDEKKLIEEDFDNSIEEKESPDFQAKKNTSEDKQLRVDEQGEIIVESDKAQAEQIVKWSQWFKELMFYQYGLAYMGVRLYCNTFSSLMNYYLIVVLQYSENPEDITQNPIQVAIIPMILYTASVLASLILQLLYKWLGRKITFTIGGVLMVISSVALALLNKEYRYLIYFVAVFVGIAQSLTLNTGLTMISEVVGIRGSSGAFVYGAYSFLDKISSGIVLFIVTNQPNDIFYTIPFIRWCIVFIPSGACAIAWVLIMVGKAKDYDNKKKGKRLRAAKNSGARLLHSSFQTHSTLSDEFAI